MFNIVLIEPEIPQNTGNIVRTAAATGCKLHLIKPLGFSLEDKFLKRAGLDYWHEAEIVIYENMEEFYSKNTGDMFYATTKGGIVYSNINYTKDCYIFFGKETKGIDEKILKANYDKCIRIPMLNETRSLNLSNSVAIIVYEGLKQMNFSNFNVKGKLRDN